MYYVIKHKQKEELNHKDEQLSQKDEQLSRKDEQLNEKDEEIRRLKQLLAEKAEKPC